MISSQFLEGFAAILFRSEEQNFRYLLFFRGFGLLHL